MFALLLCIGIFLATILVLVSSRSYEYAVANIAPLVRYGLEGQCTGTFVKANDRGQVNPEWFHPRTLILGWDKNNQRGSAQASFVFSLPRNIFTRGAQVEASLMIEAERNHGGLHSHLGPRQKAASIEANGRELDRLWLIDRMTQGEDYGYRSIGPIPIDIELLKGDTLTITLMVDAQMSWDIDRVVLQITKGSPRLTVLGSMLAGALISAGVGLLPTAINDGVTLIKRSESQASSSMQPQSNEGWEKVKRCPPSRVMPPNPSLESGRDLPRGPGSDS